METFLTVLSLLAVAGAWLYIHNISRMKWADYLSLTGIVVFMFAASWVALSRVL